LILNDLTEDEEKLLKYLNKLFLTKINITTNIRQKEETIEYFDDLAPF